MSKPRVEEIRINDAFGSLQREKDEVGDVPSIPPQSETDLANFLKRMKGTKRCFYVEVSQSAPTGGATATAAATGVTMINSNFFDDDDDAVSFYETNELSSTATLTDVKRNEIIKSNAEHRRRWTECCKREFVTRRRRFSQRFPSISSFYRQFVYTVVALAVVIFFAWPLWDFLVDVEAEEHLKTLGIESGATPNEIKKAYRQLTKQWHPDLNPDCGQRCRDMMRKIQEAHDVLLAKGDRSEEIANKYKEALLQIRSLIVFRLYQISFHAAEFLSSLALSTVAALKQYKSLLRYSTRIGIILLFTFLEVVNVTGLNVLVLLQVFYFCATMLRQSAHLTDLQKISKWSNFDIRKDFVVFVLPAMLLHTIWYWMGFISAVPEAGVFVWHFVVGSAYLAAHLSRFAPNIFDNFSLRKCSVTVEYLSKPELQFSKKEFLMTELGVLVDDLFAFTSHVPSIYRVVVWAIHGTYLTQLYLLPWDAPVKGKLQRRVDDAAALKESKSEEAKAKKDKAPSSTDIVGGEKKATPLTEREAKWFVGLDDEESLWFDLISLRYIPALQRHSIAFQKQRPNLKFECNLMCSADGTEIYVCVMFLGPDGRGFREVREKFKDPQSAQRLAREAGPNSVLYFEKPPTFPISEEVVLNKYRQIVVEDWDKTYSQLFRGPHATADPRKFLKRNVSGGDTSLKTGSSSAPVHKSVMAIVLLLLLLLLLAAACVPVDIAAQEGRDERDMLLERFDPFTPPAFTSKFTHLLPEDHLLNVGGGVIGSYDVSRALMVPDFYDSLRQLGLYQQEGSQQEDANAVMERTTNNNQQRQKAKAGSSNKEKKQGQGKKRKGAR